VTIDTEEMQVSPLWVQTHATPMQRWVVPVGTRDDWLTECVVGPGDSPIQIRVCAELFDDVNLHFDTTAADLEVFGPDTDDDFPGGIGYLTR
jgi:hypothetical protein